MENTQVKKRAWTPPPEVAVIYRIEDIVNIYRMSRSAIHKAMLEESFPLPIKLGTRSKGWIRKDVNEWFATRPSSLQPCAEREQYQSERYLNRFEAAR